MRILAFSDLHRDLGQAAELVRMAGEADVVVGAGDFASVHEGLEETIAALRPIEKPTVLVPGNNETEDELRAAVAGWEAATVLHGERLDLGGTPFFGLGGGIPVTPWDSMEAGLTVMAIDRAMALGQTVDCGPMFAAYDEARGA